MKCDLCGKEAPYLLDYFALICPECRDKHPDINLLRKIGLEIERGLSK